MKVKIKGLLAVLLLFAILGTGCRRELMEKQGIWESDNTEELQAVNSEEIRSGDETEQETEQEILGNQESWENSNRNMYQEFLEGKVSATDEFAEEKFIEELWDLNNIKYLYRDIDRDNEEELHIRSGGSYYILKCREGSLQIIYSGISYELPVNNDELCGVLYHRPGGAPKNDRYHYFTFDASGRKTEGSSYEWCDMNENGIVDDEDWFDKDDEKMERAVWEAETEAIRKEAERGNEYYDTEWACLIFEEYLPEHMTGGGFLSEGEGLLRFRKDGETIYTYWELLEPMLHENEESGKVYFAI